MKIFILILLTMSLNSQANICDWLFQSEVESLTTRSWVFAKKTMPDSVKKMPVSVEKNIFIEGQLYESSLITYESGAKQADLSKHFSNFTTHQFRLTEKAMEGDLYVVVEKAQSYALDAFSGHFKVKVHLVFTDGQEIQTIKTAFDYKGHPSLFKGEVRLYHLGPKNYQVFVDGNSFYLHQ